MRIVVRSSLVLLVTACGDVTVPAGDAGRPDASVGADARDTDAAGGCVWSEPDPLLFAAVNGADCEDSAAMTADGLRLYFTRTSASADRPPDIHLAERDGPEQPFGPSSVVAELATVEIAEYEVEIAADGDEIFFTTDSAAELWSAKRDGLGFAEPTSTSLSGNSPSISSDGLSLYYIDMGGEAVIRASRMALDADWSMTEGIGDPDVYDAIDVSSDGLSLLLTGGIGVTTTLAIASRLSTDQSFGAAVPIGLPLEGFEIPEYGKASWGLTDREIIVPIEGPEGQADFLLSRCE
jgi:hypothetical protein